MNNIAQSYYNHITEALKIYNTLNANVKSEEVIIRVGDAKIKSNVDELLQAVCQALNEGEFQMDEIDSVIYRRESKIEELKEKIYSLESEKY